MPLDYTKEQIFTQQEDGHNKYWTARVDGTDSVIRNGRLGTKGITHRKSHGSNYAATSFVHGKVREKVSKGYRAVSRAVFDKLSLEAAIVGSQNKCADMQWLDLKNASEDGFNLAIKIADEQLADPNVEPALYVSLTTKKEYNGSNSYRLVFCRFGVFDQQGRPVSRSGEFGKLLDKVEEAIAASFA